MKKKYKLVAELYNSHREGVIYFQHDFSESGDNVYIFFDKDSEYLSEVYLSKDDTLVIRPTEEDKDG